MTRIKRAASDSIEWLETDRPQPLSDTRIEQLQQDVLLGKLDRNITNDVYINFTLETNRYLNSSQLNALTGLDKFDRIDIINGCTQFIDNLYMQGKVQVLDGDYRYHSRLGLAIISTVGELVPLMPLIIAMPFPRIGAPHDNMTEILDECVKKNIPVHIDGAWITCCRDVTFDFGHNAIQSVGISLSKGLGLGWNRVGLRYTRQHNPDSVTIMNDFNMNLRATAMIGLHFVRNLPIDYLWNKYGETYYKICRDFDLTPTKSIYLALQGNEPVGLSPLIRYLENEN